MTHDFFISYAIQDQRVADQVCRALESRGVQCWMAPRDIPPGWDYEEAIVEAIAASRALLLILSTHSNNSSHVRREVQRAFAKESATKVIPFRIENVPYSKPLSYYLSSTQWIDASTPVSESDLQRLVKIVRPESSAQSVTPGNGRDPQPAEPPYGVANRALTHIHPEADRRLSVWVGGAAAMLLMAAIIGFISYRNNQNPSVEITSPTPSITNANLPAPAPTPADDPMPSPTPSPTRLINSNSNLKPPTLNRNTRRPSPPSFTANRNS